ncbi:MAG: ABC transporter permease [Tenuifilaceae bacterium]|nr:ABC transporter permease [Tenuifilaceae bacterium]
MIQLKHLFKTILRYRLSSGLTLLSLVIAFLGVIMISLYITYERSFDTFHTNGNNTYMFSINNSNFWVPALLADELKNELPEAKHTLVVSQWWDKYIYKDGEELSDAVKGDFLAVSADFLKVFDFNLLQGDKGTVLTEPKSVVISQELAHKVFGDENPVGKNVNLGHQMQYKVTGVMENMPKNSAFASDALVSFASYMQHGNDWRGAQQWSEWSFHVFIQLQGGISKDSVETKIEATEMVTSWLEIMEERSGVKSFVHLVPLADLHFTSGMIFPSVNKLVVNVLLALAIIIAIMGIVNFINFSTSQAPLRAKSISIQQIMGEKKWRSRMQIIGESVALSFIALAIALILHNASYTYIQNLFEISGLSLADRYVFVIWFALFALIFGIGAGLYPARYITSAPISQAVKGKMFFSGKGRGFRQTLITVQFVFTITLIVAAFTIEKQLGYWRNFDIGINKENVIYLYTTQKLRESHQAFADELMKNAEITDYAYTQFVPGSVGMGWGREIDGQQVQLKSWPVDERFINFFDIEIVDGRSFLEGKGDINNFILNQKAVEKFGWEKPLEKKFPGFGFLGDIVGVAKNFNFGSLKEDVEPMLFWLTDTRKNVLLLRINTGNYTQLREYIVNTIGKFEPDADMEPLFLDDSLNKLYNKEVKLARFIEYVALWCVLLALTGLLGLTIFITRDRIKEIGIRKVNGATTLQIIGMLNRTTIVWVAIAFVIATPIAYFAMDKWLQNFAYRTQLSWWVFALAGLLALVIALLTVSWQSWLAARRNPVEALRYE